MVLQPSLSLVWSPDQSPPTFEEVSRKLGPLPDLIFKAIEYGTVKNHDYFETLCDGERPRPHIREAIVRDQARRFLEQHNIEVQDDEPVALLYEPLVALVLVYEDVYVRVLKGKRGIVPGCGRSVPRKRFYNQKTSPVYLKTGRIAEIKWNLLFIWDFDAAFNVNKVWMVFPTQAGVKPSQIRYAFHEELEHPAKHIRVQPIPSGSEKLTDELRDLLQASEAISEPEEKSDGAGA